MTTANFSLVCNPQLDTLNIHDKRGRSPSQRPTKVTFFHHDFVQSGKQHSRYKTILPSIVLSHSRQYCEVW